MTRLARAMIVLAAVVLSASACGGGEDATAPPLSSTPTVTSAPGREPLRVRLEPVADLDQPLDMTHDPSEHGAGTGGGGGGTSSYVAERKGTVLRLDAGGSTEEWLDLSDRVSTTGELGLLGITFSPEGDWFYAHWSSGDRSGHLSAWPVQTGEPDLDGEVELLTVAQPFSNHNGGSITFGPDGMLYWALGDGGSAGDPEGNGQDPSTLLGSILRIDPTPGDPGAPYRVPPDNPFAGGGGAPEVWAYGLRNPWRIGFDRETGDLWIGDVGQNTVEEIDWWRAGTPAGVNYGWNAFEGTLEFPGGDAERPPGSTVPPVHEYGRDSGNSVTGGYVYRGTAVPALRGAYVFGDYGSGRIWALDVDHDTGTVRGLLDLAIELPGLVSFAETPDGELLALSIEGPVMALVEE